MSARHELVGLTYSVATEWRWECSCGSRQIGLDSYEEAKECHAWHVDRMERRIRLPETRKHRSLWRMR